VTTMLCVSFLAHHRRLVWRIYLSSTRCTFLGVTSDAGLVSNAYDCGTLGWSIVVVSKAKAPFNVTVHGMPSSVAIDEANGISIGASLEGLPALWATCGKTASTWFQQLPSPASSLSPSFVADPGCTYTLTTVTSPAGFANYTSPPSVPFALPFTDNFDERSVGQPGLYWEVRWSSTRLNSNITFVYSVCVCVCVCVWDQIGQHTPAVSRLVPSTSAICLHLAHSAGHRRNIPRC
jgi:hypothetical protein